VYKGTGGVAKDYSGQGNHGTIHGAKWTDKEIASWALDFDGVDDYVNCGDVDVTTGVISVVAWVNTTFDGDGTETGNQWVINKNYNGTNVPYGLITTTDGNVSSGIGGGGMAFYDGSWRTSGSTTDISDGTWHFVVGTYDGSTLKYYVDGSLSDSTSYSGSIPTNNENTNIGLYGNDSAYFQGSIDELRIYDRVLTESEVKDYYEKTRVLYGV